MPQASIQSRISEAVQQRVAEADYRLKVQAKQFWSVVSVLQQVRRGVSWAQKQHPH
ncbi:MAG: hypothetical protein HXX19_20845 [Rhodoferax sp.]|nr:hypothetical protein [Rhodoferax sp.]